MVEITYSLEDVEHTTIYEFFMDGKRIYINTDILGGDSRGEGAMAMLRRLEERGVLTLSEEQ